jgi:hypothetical protein
MITTIPIAQLDTGATQRELFGRRIDQFRQKIEQMAPRAALQELDRLQGELDGFVTALKARLLGTSLAWSEEEIGACDWILTSNQGLATAGQRILKLLPPGDAGACRAGALVLHYRAEAMKSAIALGRAQAPDFASLYAIMKAAIEAGYQRQSTPIQVEGEARPCCIESLLFRALLLARCAGGNRYSRQIEILDAWVWMWMPLLLSVPDPSGAAMSADLASDAGLRRGAIGDGPGVLTLPLEPVEQAYRAVLSQFHQGRIIPAQGFTAEFRIEEHVAVLDLLRRTLRAWHEQAMPRAERRAASGLVEMHVGIAEILRKAFQPSAPLAARPAVVGSAFAVDDIYSAPRRHMHLVETSSTGLQLQGSTAGWSEVVVGDLVALRIPGEALVIGRVARALPSLTSGEIVIGVSRLPGTCLPVGVTRTSDESRLDLLYVSGKDSAGRDDAYLVSSGAFAHRSSLTVEAGADTFTFRFNRVRERGRGWVLAGIEIISVSHAEAAAAA